VMRVRLEESLADCRLSARVLDRSGDRARWR